MAYPGLPKLTAKLGALGGSHDPGAVMAAIGRRKFGNPTFSRVQSAGKRMKGMTERVPGEAPPGVMPGINKITDMETTNG